MNAVDRFNKIFSFDLAGVDRLPVFEWAPWWREETLAAWRAQGLPEDRQTDWEIADYFGLDLHRQYWIDSETAACPRPAGHGQPIVNNDEEYQRLLDAGGLFPPQGFDAEDLRTWVARREAGEVFIWASFSGFFWFPRKLLGIEQHMYAFYDQGELMHRMNSDLLEHTLGQLEQFCAIARPQFITLAEDMSYNHGPMLSRECFYEFLAPYYRRLTAKLDDLGVPLIVDSDGDVTVLVDWLQDVGARGLLPLERMAGVDVCALREAHPTLWMLGGFDKTVMHKGEAAIRAEFERLLPAMRSGGYLPSCDHQTPPAVSMDDYRLYVKLFKEYARRAVE